MAVDTTAYGHVAIVLVVLQMRYRSLTKPLLKYVGADEVLATSVPFHSRE